MTLKPEGGGGWGDGRPHRTRRESSNGTLFQRVNSDRVQNFGPNRISRLSALQWLGDCLFTLLGTLPGSLEPSEATELAGTARAGFREERAPPYGCTGSTVYMNLHQPLSADRGLESSWGGDETSWGCLCLSLAINPLILARHF